MRTKINDKKVSELWQKTHPNTKQPPIKAYYTTQHDLNKIVTRSSQKGDNKFYQTKEEYGKKVTPKEGYHVSGLHYKDNGKHIVLVRRQENQTKTNTIIKHELNHCKK